MSKIPAADVVEVKRGKWKECFEDWRKQISGDECSVCGFQHYGVSMTIYNYCPNCGARMDVKNIQ
jgi:rubrerythrin